MNSPFLWYLNRATGTVLLVLFTAVVVLGILATFGRSRPLNASRVPRFLTQSFHRNVSLLALVLLVGHIVTAVVDTYVDIRWQDAFVPWGGRYMPFWLALGTISFDLILVIVATSLVRDRLGHIAWRAIHLTGYAAWVASTLHGLGIGTDSTTSWSRMLTWVCVAAVVLAVFLRLGASAFRREVRA